MAEAKPTPEQLKALIDHFLLTVGDLVGAIADWPGRIPAPIEKAANDVANVVHDLKAAGVFPDD